jgi:hypothetical protein
MPVACVDTSNLACATHDTHAPHERLMQISATAAPAADDEHGG